MDAIVCCQTYTTLNIQEKCQLQPYITKKDMDAFLSTPFFSVVVVVVV